MKVTPPGGGGGLTLSDEDDMATDSAARPPSQQSVKAYVDGLSLSLIDEDAMGTNSAARPPSQQSVKAYIDNEISARPGKGFIGTSAIASGKWTLPGWTGYGSGTRSMGTNTIYYIPIAIDTADNYDRIVCEITGGAGASKLVRLGRYNSSKTNGFYAPTTRIADDGTIDANSAAIHQVTIDWTPSPGVFFLALETDDAAATLRTQDNDYVVGSAFGTFNTTSSVIFNNDSLVLTEAAASAGAPGLPSTATPAALTHNGFIMCMLRIA